jgi:hypothetical protein
MSDAAGDVAGMDRLYAVLHRWHAAPFAWGRCDCMIVLADWVREVRGFDPADGLRGTYGDPAICARGAAFAADPAPVLRRAFAPLDLTDVPAPGDVALVGVFGQPHAMGALRLRRGAWAIKTAGRGAIVLKSVRLHLCWSVGYAA